MVHVALVLAADPATGARCSYSMSPARSCLRAAVEGPGPSTSRSAGSSGVHDRADVSVDAALTAVFDERSRCGTSEQARRRPESGARHRFPYRLPGIPSSHLPLRPDLCHRQRLGPDVHLVDVAGEEQVAGRRGSRRSWRRRSGRCSRSGPAELEPSPMSLPSTNSFVRVPSNVPATWCHLPSQIEASRRRRAELAGAVPDVELEAAVPARLQRVGGRRAVLAALGDQVAKVPGDRWRLDPGADRELSAARGCSSGIVTKSSPPKFSALPKKMPFVHAGSLESAAGVEPRKPLLPLPDQSWTVWPLPSLNGHQPLSGKSPAAEAAAGTASEKSTAA